VAGLIISVALTLGATVLTANHHGTVNLVGVAMAAGVFLGVYLKKVDPFKMIVLCALLGVLLFR
jgi:hypothetical protein